MNSHKQPYIIDTDCGIDDAQCIITSLWHLNVVALTCVAGNSPLDTVVANTAKVLEVCREERPIYKGCKVPIIMGVEVDSIHGQDGIGDTEIMKTVDGYTQCIDNKEHAVNAIIRLANKYKGELNLMCIGPLTNIGLALRLDPTLASKIKTITVMGGTSGCVGNMTLCTEFNFRQDPEAAAIVFREFKNIKLLTWNCAQDTEPTTKKQKDKLYYTHASTPLGEFHRDSNEHFNKSENRFYITDCLCPIAIVDPSSIKKSFKAFGVIDTSNGMSKGMIQYYQEGCLPYMLDIMKKQHGVDIDANKPNVEVISLLDVDKSIEVITQALKGLNERIKSNSSTASTCSYGSKKTKKKAAKKFYCGPKQVKKLKSGVKITIEKNKLNGLAKKLK